MTEATEQEMREAVERWARARGCMRNPPGPDPASWYVLDTSASVAVIGHGPDKRWRFDGFHVALVWALVIEAELPRVDVGGCDACAGAGWRETGVEHGGMVESYPCPDCSGTGREHRDVARLLLDAQSVPRGNPAVYQWTEPGDPAAIEHLLVLSDLLQPDLLRRADGPPRDLAREALGIHIAHLLAGKREGTEDAVEQLDKRLGFEWHETQTWHYNSSPQMRANQTAWLREQGWTVAEIETLHYTRHLCSRPRATAVPTTSQRA